MTKTTEYLKLGYVILRYADCDVRLDYVGMLF